MKKLLFVVAMFAFYSVSVFEEYACQLVDSIGRIYIVNIPIDSILPLSTDSRIERIDAGYLALHYCCRRYRIQLYFYQY